MFNNGSPLKRETDALRSIQANPDAKNRVIKSLSNRHATPVRVRRPGFASFGFVFAGALTLGFAVFLLAPKSASASAKSVLRAIQSVPAYRVRSYEKIDGRMVLAGETFVDGAKRKLVLYDPSGKPVSDDLSQTAQKSATVAIEKVLAERIPDTHQDNSIKVSSSSFDNHHVTEGPVTVKGIVHHGPHGRPFVVITGLTCVDQMMDMLRTADDWSIARGVRYHGLALDKYTCPGWGDFFAIYVDPLTDRPLYLHIQDAEDAFDYGRP